MKVVFYIYWLCSLGTGSETSEYGWEWFKGDKLKHGHSGSIMSQFSSDSESVSSLARPWKAATMSYLTFFTLSLSVIWESTTLLWNSES